MSSVSGGATVIVDKDGGDAVTVTHSKLDVNVSSEIIDDIKALMITPTAITSYANTDIDTSAEQLVSDVTAYRRIDLQAHRDNTGIIYVGDSGVTADGAGGGISLAAGDYYSIAIDHTNDVYLIASVVNQKVTANLWA